MSQADFRNPTPQESIAAGLWFLRGMLFVVLALAAIGAASWVGHRFLPDLTGDAPGDYCDLHPCN